MHQRIALALLATSLFTFPACSNGATTPSNTSQEPSTTASQEPPAITVNAEVLKKRQDPRVTQDFLDAVQGNVYSYTTLTPEQNKTLLKFGQQVCVDSDNGKTLYDLAVSQGFDDEGRIDYEEDETLSVAALAVYMICPEHQALADAAADIRAGNFPGNVETTRRLRRSNDTAAQEVFFKALESTVFPGRTFDETQRASYWLIAIQACSEFDTGISEYDWALGNDINLDGPLDQSAPWFLAIAIAGVKSACPEHIAIANSLAKRLP